MQTLKLHPRLTWSRTYIFTRPWDNSKESWYLKKVTLQGVVFQGMNMQISNHSWDRRSLPKGDASVDKGNNSNFSIGMGQSMLCVISNSCSHWIVFENKASIILQMDVSFWACFLKAFWNTLPESHLQLYYAAAVQSPLTPFVVMWLKSTT